MPDPAPVVAANPERYITIHGHFYQPPRENPWLETVETQDSAAPYHDWNERITAECYAPNGAARIVNRENLIIRIINNYARISFNFGPTLLSWLEENAPRAYRHILEADRRSQLRFGGHGSAMAQVYNHIIMPLASTRDRITQIRWSIADFESRFKRKPETGPKRPPRFPGRRRPTPASTPPVPISCGSSRDEASRSFSTMDRAPGRSPSM